MTKEKTHWLHNPNKNYLGHQDLPDGKEVVLTIASAGWEAVENPVLNTKEEKRVVRFSEKHKWVKPWICNASNARMAMKVTKDKYIEESVGKRLKIGISQTKVKGQEVDCLRVRDVSQSSLQDKKITDEQTIEIQELLAKTDKSAADICKAYEVEALPDLLALSYVGVVKTLNRLIQQNKKVINENT
tara:strand:+ start:341 stop:901 length:561 start_codon:yes stop_codon:yes gene_type:complete